MTGRTEPPPVLVSFMNDLAAAALGLLGCLPRPEAHSLLCEAAFPAPGQCQSMGTCTWNFSLQSSNTCPWEWKRTGPLHAGSTIQSHFCCYTVLCHCFKLFHLRDLISSLEQLCQVCSFSVYRHTAEAFAIRAPEGRQQNPI